MSLPLWNRCFTVLSQTTCALLDIRCFSSSNFQHPIAVKSEAKEGYTPAPNTYNLSGVHTGKNTLVTAEAAFKSQSKREGVIVGAANPAPGHYSIKDTLLHQSTRTHRAVFESRSRREGVGRPVQVNDTLTDTRFLHSEFNT